VVVFQEERPAARGLAEAQEGHEAPRISGKAWGNWETYIILSSITHRIHGAGIYAHIWGILMVNVTIYSIHGSYGVLF
jgi:hypothetical protein